MAPTPLIATYKVAIRYTILGDQHTMNLLCDATPSSSSPSAYDMVQTPQPPREVDSAVKNWVNLLKTAYGTDSNFDDYTLYHYVAPNYVPVWSANLGIAGTFSQAPEVATQTTMTYRTGTYKFLKLIMLESVLAAPSKYTDISGTAYYQLIAKDPLNVVDGHVGAWLRGRDGTSPVAFKAIVVGLNRKLRRHRGLS